MRIKVVEMCQGHGVDISLSWWWFSFHLPHRHLIQFFHTAIKISCHLCSVWSIKCRCLGADPFTNMRLSTMHTVHHTQIQIKNREDEEKKKNALISSMECIWCVSLYQNAQKRLMFLGMHLNVPLALLINCERVSYLIY